MSKPTQLNTAGVRIASAFLLLQGIAFEGSGIMLLSVICWIGLGLLAGLAAGKLANGRDEGIRADLALGTGGALFGGWLFKAFAGVGMTGFDVRSLAVAFSGSLVFLVIGRTIRSQRSHA